MFPIKQFLNYLNNYLNYALQFTPQEERLIRELNKWLPEEIIDAHSHASAQNQCRFLDESFLSRVSSTFPWFEVEKHIEVNRILYPKKKITMILFPFPHRGIDHQKANHYILNQSVSNSWIVPILFGLSDNIEYTLLELKTGKFYGLKMYPAYFHSPARKISEYYPDQILQCCEEMGIPIILHLPQNIVECEKDLVATIKKFPRLKIILAHMGLLYLPIKGFKETFARLSKCENLYLDTAMVTSPEVLRVAIDIFGYHRIIYGTDQPLNLVRGKMYLHSRLGIRIATEYPYHWIDSEEQRKTYQYAVNASLLHWQILSALKKAICSFRKDEKEMKNYIFSENAKKVFRLNDFTRT